MSACIVIFLSRFGSLENITSFSMRLVVNHRHFDMFSYDFYNATVQEEPVHLLSWAAHLLVRHTWSLHHAARWWRDGHCPPRRLFVPSFIISVTRFSISRGATSVRGRCSRPVEKTTRRLRDAVRRERSPEAVCSLCVWCQSIKMTWVFCVTIGTATNRDFHRLFRWLVWSEDKYPNNAARPRGFCSQERSVRFMHEWDNSSHSVHMYTHPITNLLEQQPALPHNMLQNQSASIIPVTHSVPSALPARRRRGRTNGGALQPGRVAWLICRP